MQNFSFLTFFQIIMLLQYLYLCSIYMLMLGKIFTFSEALRGRQGWGFHESMKKSLCYQIIGNVWVLLPVKVKDLNGIQL